MCSFSNKSLLCFCVIITANLLVLLTSSDRLAIKELKLFELTFRFFFNDKLLCLLYHLCPTSCSSQFLYWLMYPFWVGRTVRSQSKYRDSPSDSISLLRFFESRRLLLRSAAAAAAGRPLLVEAKTRVHPRIDVRSGPVTIVLNGWTDPVLFSFSPRSTLVMV